MIDQRLKEIKERWKDVEKRATVPGENLDELQSFLADLNHARTDVPMLLEMVEYYKKWAPMWRDDRLGFEKGLEKIAEKYK